MKTNSLPWHYLNNAAVLLTLAFVSCTSQDNPGIRVDYLSATPAVSVALLDAATGELLTDTTISGSLAGAALDSEADSDYSVDNGILTFALENAEPTEDDPVRLRLTASADGYVATAIPLIISSNEAAFEMRLVNQEDPPTGVTVTVDTSLTAGADGRLSDATTITTNADPVTGTQTTLTFQSGTSFVDNSGAVLTGPLTTTVTVFNPVSDASLQAFPGSLDAQFSQDESGRASSGTFVSAGLVNVTIENASGATATATTSPVSVAMQVPTDLVNPETGEALSADDDIPLWSLDPETALWEFVERLDFTIISEGAFQASFETTDLSRAFNVDWSIGERCGSSGPLRIEGNEDNVPLTVVLRDVALGRIISKKQLQGYTSRRTSASDVADVVTFYNVDRERAMQIQLLEDNGDIVGSTTVSDLCTMDETVTVTPADTVSLIVNASVTCDGTEIALAAPFYFRRIPSGEWRPGWIQNGENSFSGLRSNSTYEVTARILDQWVTTTIATGNGEDIDFALELDPAACALL